MELVQDKISGIFSIQDDGFMAVSSDDYFNHTDEITSWSIHGLALTDGKMVKNQVSRIVNLETGATFNDRFNAIAFDEIKVIAGKEVLFNLPKATLTVGSPALMTEEEYESARLYRQSISAVARKARWDYMMTQLSTPDVLASLGKLAFLVEEMKKYEKDYLGADNKIFEAFLTGTDHPLDAIPTYPRAVDFGTTAAISLMGLPLWDDVNLGGTDAPYKTLVTGIIKDAIATALQYIS